MGDHSSRPYVAGRLKRPTRRRGAPEGARSDGPPFARLPIWSCTARSLPGRACHQTRRCALTLSPGGPHRFTHHPLQDPRRAGPLAGLFSVALVVARRQKRLLSQPLNGRRPAVSGLAALRCSDFPLPRFSRRGSDRPTCSRIRGADYSKAPLNTYSPKASAVKTLMNNGVK